MNSLSPRATNAAVRSSIVCWIVALALGSQSCAPTLGWRQLFANRPAPRAGTITAVVASDLRWPVRLYDVRLAIDARLARAAEPVAAIEGEHLVAMRAELRWPCSVAGSEARVMVADTVPLVMGTNGVEVQFAVLARGTVFDRPEQRFVVDNRVVGRARRDVAQASWVRFEELVMAECRSLVAPEDARCRVRVRRDRAIEQRDIVQLTCQREKLEAIERVLRAAAGAPLSDEARARIASLESESRQCVGETLYFAGPTVNVLQTCEGEDEAPAS